MQVWLQPSVSTRRGGSCTRGGKPDASGNPGRPEGLPRTAAIKRHLILARVSTPVRRIVSDSGSVGGQHFQDKPMGADSVRRIFPRTGYLPAISCHQALSQASLPALCWSWLACDDVGGVSMRSRCLHRGQARLLQAGAGSVGAGLPAMASARCQCVRGVCIAGKPGSYKLARALLELACLRWPRRGVSALAASASRASPAPTGWRGLCWSWLACDDVGGVPVRSRRLHRGQARLLQAGAGSVGAGLPAMASARCQCVSGVCIAGKPGSYRLARALLELACLRWPRWGVSAFAVSASRASPAPTGWREFCWSWLACDGLGAVSVR
ncbi:hypothetical protein AB7M23_000874 [Pseudomonas sp. HLS-6 TE3448]